MIEDMFEANLSEYLGVKCNFERIVEEINKKWKTVEYENKPKYEDRPK